MNLGSVFKRLINRMTRLGKWLLWQIQKNSHESIYFYTFHKCASTLFNEYILHNVKGLRNVDYASLIYLDHSPNISFQKFGYVYGPLRISEAPDNPIYKKLMIPVMRSDFIHDKQALFFIRDPRDILVSQYYSFGFTHGLSPNLKIKEMELSNRERIQNMTLDEYAIQMAPVVQDHFNMLKTLSDRCMYSVILKYEDMINDFDKFSEGLSQCFQLDESVIKEIYLKSRPKEVEDTSSHRRSGKAGGFRTKLEKKTIKRVNTILQPTLKYFQYSD